MATQFGSLRAFLERCDEHGFGPVEIQRLVESWDILKLIGEGTLTREMLKQITEQAVNPFVGEKTEHLDLYTVEEQVKALQELYPDMDSSQVVKLSKRIPVPYHAGGLFVIPKPSSVAARMGINDPYGAGYYQLLETTVLVYLARQQKFSNWLEEETGRGHLRMRESTADALQRLEEEQSGDYLVFAAQLGTKWDRYIPHDAKSEMELSNNEFPLPAWVVGHILLTGCEIHGEFEHVIIDCVGDEYLFEPDIVFSNYLFFIFGRSESVLSHRWEGHLSLGGLVSGFFP